MSRIETYNINTTQYHKISEMDFIEDFIEVFIEDFIENEFIEDQKEKRISNLYH